MQPAGMASERLVWSIVTPAFWVFSFQLAMWPAPIASHARLEIRPGHWGLTLLDYQPLIMCRSCAKIQGTHASLGGGFGEMDAKVRLGCALQQFMGQAEAAWSAAKSSNPVCAMGEGTDGR
jgi:hypothetical protein